MVKEIERESTDKAEGRVLFNLILDVITCDICLVQVKSLGTDCTYTHTKNWIYSGYSKQRSSVAI